MYQIFILQPIMFFIFSQCIENLKSPESEYAVSITSRQSLLSIRSMKSIASYLIFIILDYMKVNMKEQRVIAEKY